MTDNKEAPKAAPKFARKAAVTLPTISFKDGNSMHRFLQITGKIYEGKPVKKSGDKADKPADLCEVVDMETGEQALFIVPTVVKSNLEEKYAAGAYVGKGFEIICHGTKEGKRYKTYSIYEVEVK